MSCSACVEASSGWCRDPSWANSDARRKGRDDATQSQLSFESGGAPPLNVPFRSAASARATAWTFACRGPRRTRRRIRIPTRATRHVGERDQAKREEALHPERLTLARLQVERQPGECRAAGPQKVGFGARRTAVMGPALSSGIDRRTAVVQFAVLRARRRTYAMRELAVIQAPTDLSIDDSFR